MTLHSLSPCSEIAAVCDGQVVNFLGIETGLVQATITLSCNAEYIAWSNSGVYAVIADTLGGLNFVLKTGKLLFRHPLMQASQSETAFFGSLQFVPSDMNVEKDELIVLGSDGKLFHFSNISSKLLLEISTSTSPASLLKQLQTDMVTCMTYSSFSSQNKVWMSCAKWMDKTRLILCSTNVENQTLFSIETWEVNSSNQKSNLVLINTSSFPKLLKKDNEKFNVIISASTSLYHYDMILISIFESGKEIEWWIRNPDHSNLWTLTSKWNCTNEQEVCIDVLFGKTKNNFLTNQNLIGHHSEILVLIKEMNESSFQKGWLTVLRSEPYLNQEEPLLMLTERIKLPINENLFNLNDGKLSFLQSSFSSSSFPSLTQPSEPEKLFIDIISTNMMTSPSPIFQRIDMIADLNIKSHHLSNHYERSDNKFVNHIHEGVNIFFSSLVESIKITTTTTKEMLNNDKIEDAFKSLALVVKSSLNELISTPSLFLIAIRLLHDIVPLCNSFPSSSATNIINHPPMSRLLDSNFLRIFLSPCVGADTSSAEPLVSLIFIALKEALQQAINNCDSNDDDLDREFYTTILDAFETSERKLLTASRILIDVPDRAEDIILNQSSSKSDHVGVCHLGAEEAWSLMMGGDPLSLMAQCLKLRLIAAAGLIWRNHGVPFLLHTLHGQSLGHISLSPLQTMNTQPQQNQPMDEFHSSLSTESSLLLIDDGAVVVDMLSAAPYDIHPLYFSLWVEGEVVPVLSPGALVDVRSWATARCRCLCSSHPRNHPEWAISLASAVDRGCLKYLGVSATVDTSFVRWQGHILGKHSLDHVGSAESGETPRRSLSAHFDEMASSSPPQQGIAPKPSSVSPPLNTLQRNRITNHGVRNGALWCDDELTGLLKRLTELQLLWDVHHLELPLEQYEKISPQDVVFKLLDRAQEYDHQIKTQDKSLMEHIQCHVIPFAKSRQLDLMTVLIDYTIKISQLMTDRPPTRSARNNLKNLSKQRKFAQAAKQLAIRKNQKSTLALGISSKSNRMDSMTNGGGGLVKKTSLKSKNNDPSSSSSSSSLPGGNNDEGFDVDDLAAEVATLAKSDEHMRLSENGVAVLKCIGELLNDELCSSDDKTEATLLSSLGMSSSAELSTKVGVAALSLLRATVPPLAPGIKSLASDITAGKLSKWGLEWFSQGGGDSVGDELREAARLLRILEIVAQYTVSNFDVFDPKHASRLVNFLCTFHQLNSPSTSSHADNLSSGIDDEEDTAAVVAAGGLDDALHICNAYTHLSAAVTVGRYLGNILSIRAISEEELDFALTKLSSREEALVVSDKILEACLNGLDRVSAASNTPKISPISSSNTKFDRYSLTGLRISVFWSNHETRQRINDKVHSFYHGDDNNRMVSVSPTPSASTSSVSKDINDEEDATTLDHLSSRNLVAIRQFFGMSGYRILDPITMFTAERKGSQTSGPAGLVNDFNKIRSLQNEFGILFSLSNLQDNSGITSIMTNIVENRLSVSLINDAACTPSPPLSSSKSESDKKKKKRGGNSECLNDKKNTEHHAGMEILRRAAYLLNIPWPSVAAEVAKKALSSDASPFKNNHHKSGAVYFENKVGDALEICQDIWSSGTVSFRAGHDSSSLFQKDKKYGAVGKKEEKSVVGSSIKDAEIAAADAALALRDIAGSFSRAIIKPSSSASSQNSSLIPLAAAEALRLLQRSVTICSREDLPRALDFLRCAEIVSSVLSRTLGGEKFELHGSRSTMPSSSAKGIDPLHEWDRGDGLLLPPAETQALASMAALTELSDLQYLAFYGKLPSSSSVSPTAGASISQNSSMKNRLTTPSNNMSQNKQQTPLIGRSESVGVELIDLLMKHGAAKSALKIMAGGIHISLDGDAMNKLVPILTAVSESALVLAVPDFSLAFGAISALPQRSGFSTINKMISNVIFGDRDYRKLEVLGILGISVATIWKQSNYVQQFEQRNKQAQWWHKLEMLEIPFDHKALTPTIVSSSNITSSSTPISNNQQQQNNVTIEAAAGYASQLIPALLERLNDNKNSLFEVRAFAKEFGVKKYIPDLLYAEHVLKNRSLLIQSSSLSSFKNSSNSMMNMCGLFVDIENLDCALFGGINKSTKTNNKKNDDDDCGPPPLDLVLRLLRGVLQTLMEIDYEGIEYICEAILKTLDLMMSNKSLSQKNQLLFEEEKNIEQEIQENEKKLEVISLLRGLQLSMPSSTHISSSITTQGIEKANHKKDDMMSRIPLFALLERPREILTMVVNVSNIHKINVVGRCLGLRSGECYALLLRNRFTTHEPYIQNETSNPDTYSDDLATSSKQQNIILPSKTDTVKWLMEIEDLSLGVETAEWLSEQVVGYDKQSVLEGAINLAKQWKRSANSKQHLEEEASADIILKKLSSSLLIATCEAAVKSVDPTFLDKLVTSSNNNRQSGEVRLKDLLSNPSALIIELYNTASLTAAQSALATIPSSFSIASNDCSSVTGLHSFAKLLLASVERIAQAASVASMNTVGGGDVPISGIRQKLVREWLEKPLSAAVSIKAASSATSSSSSSGRGNKNLPNSNNSVVDDSKSVFRVPLRALADMEDSELALRVAVLLAPLSHNDRHDALRVLLDVAVGHLNSAKQTSRTHLRALRALSIIASPKEVNSLIGTISNHGNRSQGNILKLNFDSFNAVLSSDDIQNDVSRLKSMATQGLRLSQVAWLEELHLPTQGLLDGLGESLVRALWRDHNRETLLPPLLLDVLLTVTTCQISSPSSTSPNRGMFNDAYLWISLLNACIEGGHWRELLSILPRFGIAFKASKLLSLKQQKKWSELEEKQLIHIWDLILRQPLVELEQRSRKNNSSNDDDHRDSTSFVNNVDKKSQGALPSLSSSIVFGSVLAPPPSLPPTLASKAQSTSLNENTTSGAMEEFCGLNEVSVLPVLGMIVSGLRSCPFLHEMDLTYFATAILGSSKHYSSIHDNPQKEEIMGVHQQIKCLSNQVASLGMGPVERNRIEATMSHRII